MVEHDFHKIEPGMEVYDSAGHEIGTVARVFRQVYLPASGTDPDTALTGEDMVDVKTNRLSRSGRRSPSAAERYQDDDGQHAGPDQVPGGAEGSGAARHSSAAW